MVEVGEIGASFDIVLFVGVVVAEDEDESPKRTNSEYDCSCSSMVAFVFGPSSQLAHRLHAPAVLDKMV